MTKNTNVKVLCDLPKEVFDWVEKEGKKLKKKPGPQATLMLENMWRKSLPKTK